MTLVVNRSVSIKLCGLTDNDQIWRGNTGEKHVRRVRHASRGKVPLVKRRCFSIQNRQSELPV